MAITPRRDAQPGEAASRRGYGRPRWRFTEPAVLLLLTEGPSHGYQLVRRLRSLLSRNAPPPDTGGVYRLLRSFEDGGLVRSSWAENPGAGPARHVYELTNSGRHELDEWVPAIAEEIQALSGLLAGYYGAPTGDHFREANPE